LAAAPPRPICFIRLAMGSADGRGGGHPRCGSRYRESVVCRRCSAGALVRRSWIRPRRARVRQAGTLALARS
jgi:hypothetical protein